MRLDAAILGINCFFLGLALGSAWWVCAAANSAAILVNVLLRPWEDL